MGLVVYGGGSVILQFGMHGFCFEHRVGNGLYLALACLQLTIIPALMVPGISQILE